MSRDQAIYTWKDQESLARRVRTVEYFVSKLDGRNPNLVVFPEYSVPEEAHSLLKKYSEDNNCIVVAGSYYDADHSSTTYRNNVCKIYIPREPPLSIIKLNGYRKEQEVLQFKEGYPNIGRLHYIAEDKKPISISIYLCRDYLIPYHSRGVVADPKSEDARQWFSELDWVNEGLNIVVMHSPESQLFEGQAAFDVRRMRGAGKIVALCNCALTEGGYGSELLAPAGRRKRGDVVDELPADREGLLIADLRLTDIAYTETKPDTQTSEPVQSVEVESVEMWSLFVGEDDKPPTLEPITAERPILKRGAWHPAFLDVIGRELHIHFYPSTHLGNINRAFANGHISHVYAAQVRGEHDVMLRRYASRNEPDNFEPLSGHLYSSLGIDLRNFVDEERRLKFVVQAGDILKYRGVIIPQGADWRQKRSRIEGIFPETLTSDTRKRRLQAVCRLATDWDDPNVSPAERKQLDAAFAGTELLVDIGSEQGNCLRDTIILVAPFPDNANIKTQFEADVIQRSLLHKDEVRSVFRIIPEKSPTPFQYWVQIIGNPWVADRLADEMRGWFEERGQRIGTRTVDVTDVLLREAIDGLVNTEFTQIAIAFIKRIQECEPSTKEVEWHRYLAETESLLSRCCEAWVEQQSLTEGVLDDPDIEATFGVNCAVELTRFYGLLYLGNVADASRRNGYRRGAGDAWRSLYRTLEGIAGRALEKITQTAGSELQEALDSRIRKRIGENAWNHLQNDQLGLAIRIMQEDGNSEEKKKAAAVRKLYEGAVKKFRNPTTHGYPYPTENSLSLEGEDWRKRLHEISTATGALAQVLAETWRWLISIEDASTQRPI